MGAKSVLSLNWNMETPLASPEIGESASQESPTGLRGEDAGKSKGRSVMERIGMWQLLCDKQADFQQVMKDEKAGRTII